jgi:hypothetical protein
MNITELKIKNAIYEFGLTDEDIKTLQKSFSDCKGRQGTTFIVRGKSHVFGVKFDSYDNKPNIVMQDGADVSVLPTTIIGRWKLQFMPTKEQTDFIELLHGKLDDNRRGYNRNEDGENILTASDGEEIKTELRKLLIAQQGGSRDNLKGVDDDFVRAVFWVFNQTADEQIFDEKRTDSVKRILHVFEQDNVRLSLCRGDYRENFNFKRFTPDDEAYNYIDKGRYFLGRLYLWDDIAEAEIDEDFVEKCGSKFRFKLINAEEYRHTQRKYRLKVQKEKEEQELKEQLKTEAEKRLKNMNSKTEIQINGIVFKSNGIHYSGQEITGTFTPFKKGWREINDWGDYYTEKLDSFRNPEQLDFNIMFEQFVDELVDCEFDGQLGSIKVKVEITETETKNDRTLTRYKINGVRINKEEIIPMLKRAICFDKVEDYNALLEKVSKCNLQFHELISNGLQIKFSESAFSSTRYDREGNQIMKLIIIRKANKNYLVVGDKEFQISDTNKLINRSIKNKNQRYTPTFSELTTLFKEMFTMDDDDLIVLFRNGLKEYVQAVKKSEQFLSETLQLFKVSEIEKDGKHGYLITGSSGQQYLLTKDLKIYTYPSLSYICIVDKDVGQGFTNDRIVNRIYALSNDSRVAKEIYTLKPHATAGATATATAEQDVEDDTAEGEE